MKKVSKRVWSIILSILMLITTVGGDLSGYTVRQAKAAAGDAPYEIMVNGKSFAGGAYTVAYGDEVKLTLDGLDEKYPVEYIYTSADKPLKPTTVWKDLSDNIRDGKYLCLEPGSYYLGYNAETADGNKGYSNGGFKLVVTKAKVAAPVVSWKEDGHGAYASWEMPEKTATGGYLQPDNVLSFNLSFQKDGKTWGESDTSSLAVDLLEYHIGTVITNKAKGGFGHYTFVVKATVAETNKYYVTSDLGESEDYDYHDTSLPDISDYSVVGSSLSATVEDEDTGISAYAFSTEKDSAKVENWTTVSQEGEETYTFSPKVAGKFYFHAKDGYGNAAVSAEGIPVTKIIYHGFSYENKVAQDKTVIKLGSEKITLEQPTRRGFEFDGWFTDEEYNTEVKTLADSDLAKAHEVYANWGEEAVDVQLSCKDFVAGNISKTYDGRSSTIKATVPESLTYDSISYQWYKDGKALSGETSNTITVKNANQSGTYTVKATVHIEGEDDKEGTAGFELDIERVALNITAKDQEITYGDAKPEFDYTYSGFIDGEDVSDLTVGQAKCEYKKGDDVRRYDIVLDEECGFESPNYEFHFTNGELNVVAKNAAEKEDDFDIALSIPEEGYTYNGEEHKPAVTVSDQGTELTDYAKNDESYDYKITYLSNINAGKNTAKVQVDFFGNYTGTLYKTFTIKKDTYSTTATISGWKYGDTPGVPSVEQNHGTAEDVTYQYREVLGEDSYSKWTTKQPVNAGKYQMQAIIAAVENYEEVESNIVNFTITPRTIILETMGGTWEHDGNAHSMPLVSMNLLEGDEFAVGDGFRTLRAPVSVTDACKDVKNEIQYTLTTSTLEKNYIFIKREGTLTITPEPLICPTFFGWNENKPGTASWIAVSRENVEVNYEVKLYRKGQLSEVAHITTAGTEHDFSTIIREDSKENGIGEYYFTLQTIPQAGEGVANYKEGEVSGNSASLYTSLVTLAIAPGDEGVSSVKIGEEGAITEVVVLAGESYPISCEFAKGYDQAETTWRTTAPQITIADDASPATSFKLTAALTEAAQYTIYAISEDEMPVAEIGFQSYGDQYKSVNLTMTGSDSKGIVGYYFGKVESKAAFEELKDSSISWVTEGITTTDINGYEVFSLNKSVSEEGFYVFAVKDNSGNVAWVEEPFGVYSIRFAKGNEAATGSMDSILKAEDADITLPANGFEVLGSSFIRWSAAGLSYKDQDILSDNQSELLTALWNEDAYEYYVDFYYMNTEGEYVDPALSERLTFVGGYGETVNRSKEALQKNKLGFVMDLEHTVENFMVTGNDQTMKVYYKRTQYQMKYKYIKPGESDYTDVCVDTYYYGQDLSDIAEKEAPEFEGYAFSGWAYGAEGTKPAVMKNHDVEVIGSYSPKEATYKVNYYLQRENSTEYELIEGKSETYSGYHAEEITATIGEEDEYAKKLEGCSIQKVSASVGAGTVVPAEDAGSSVTVSLNATPAKMVNINYYYGREQYQVTLNVWKDNRLAEENKIYQASWNYEYGHVFTEEETRTIANYYAEYVLQSQACDMAPKAEDVAIQKSVDLRGYIVTSYEDWSTGGRPAKMSDGNISITRDYVLNNSVEYAVDVYFQNEDGISYSQQGTLNYFAAKGSIVKVGNASKDDSVTLDVSNFSSLVNGFNYYTFNPTAEGSQLIGEVKDPNVYGLTRFKVYFDRSVTTARIEYYVQPDESTPVDAKTPFAVETKSGVWGSAYDCDPLKYFKDDVVFPNDGTGKTYNLLSDGYIASFAGSYYLNGNVYPSYRFTETEHIGETKPYLTAKGAITKFGQVDSTIKVYYTIPLADHLFHLDVRKATDSEDKTYVNSSYEPLTAVINGKTYNIQIVNKAEVYQASYGSNEDDYAPYVGAAKLHGTWTYNEDEEGNELLKDGYKKIDGLDALYEYFTYTPAAEGEEESEDNGILYVVMNDQNQLFYGNRFGLSFNKDSYVYKQAKAYADAYVLNGVTGTNIWNNSASGIIYADNSTFDFSFVRRNSYWIVHKLGNNTCKGHEYSEGVDISLDALKNISADKFDDIKGYDVEWYTDGKWKSPLTSGITNLNETHYLYGKYKKKLVNYHDYVYYQLADEVTIPGFEPTRYITADYDYDQLVEDGILEKEVTTGETRTLVDATVEDPYEYTQEIAKYYYRISESQRVLVAKDTTECTYALNEITYNYEPDITTGYRLDSENTDNVLNGYCEGEELDLNVYMARITNPVTVNKNNEDVVSEYTMDCSYEQTVNITNPVREGYIFDGWTSDDIDVEDIKIEDDKSSFKMPLKPVSLRAKWRVGTFDVDVTHHFANTLEQFETELFDMIQEAPEDIKSKISNVYVNDSETPVTATAVYEDNTKSKLLAVVVTDGDDKYYYVPDEISAEKVEVSYVGLFALQNKKSITTDEEVAYDALAESYPMFTVNNVSYEVGNEKTTLNRGTMITKKKMITNYYYTRNNDYAVTLVAKATDNGVTGATLSGQGNYSYGMKAMLHATLSEGYTFKGWYKASDVLKEYTEAANLKELELKEDISGYDAVSTEKNYVFRVKDSTALVAVVVPKAIQDGTEIILNSDEANYVYGYQSCKTIKATAVLPEDMDKNVYVSGYQWYDTDGNPIDGATKPTFNFGLGLDAGKYKYSCEIELTRSDNGRVVQVMSNQYTVKVAKAELKVESSGYEEVYDGQNHSISINQVSGIEGEAWDASDYDIYYSLVELSDETISDEKKVNIEKKDVNFDVEQKKAVPYTIYYYVVPTKEAYARNYESYSSSENILIKPKELVVVPTENKFSKVFDGSAIVQGSVNNLEDHSNENTDKYRLSHGDGDVKYYTITGYLEDEKENLTLDFDAEYNSAHVKSAGAITLSNMHVIYKEETSLVTDYNYAFSTGATLTLQGMITPKMLNMTWGIGADPTGTTSTTDGTISASYAYNGETHEPVATLYDDEDGKLSLAVSGGQANHGSYVAQATIQKTDALDEETQIGDYKLKQKDCAFTVSALEVTISPVDDSVEYDGNKHSLENFEIYDSTDEGKTVLNEAGTFTFELNDVSYRFTSDFAGTKVGQDVEQKDVDVYNYISTNIQIYNVTTKKNVTDNFVITNGTGTLTITPKEVRLSGVEALDKAYDGTTSVTLKTDGVDFIGKVPGDDLTVDPAKLSASFDSSSVGDRTATICILDGALGGTSAKNYTLNTEDLSATATITKSGLTLIPQNITMVYGEAVPFGVTSMLGGFFESDNKESVTASGTMNVTVKNDSGKTVASYAYVVGAGTKLSELEQGVLSAAEYSNVKLPVGNYTYMVDVTGLTAGDYTLRSSASATIQVSKRPVTVSAKVGAATLSKTYDKNKTVSKTLTDLILANGYEGDYVQFETESVETSSGVMSDDESSFDFDEDEPFVAEFDSEHVDLAENIILKDIKVNNANYEIRYENALQQAVNLAAKITPKALTITASGDSIVYGSGFDLTTCDVTVGDKQLIAGDTIDNILPELSFSTNYDKGAAETRKVGSYDIVPIPGTVTHGDYAVTPINGALEVTKKEVIVTVNPVEAITYGSSVASDLISASYAGWIEEYEEDENKAGVIEGTQYFTIGDYNTKASSIKPDYAGEWAIYPILTGADGITSDNYKFKAGETTYLKVSKRALYMLSTQGLLTVDDKVYDGTTDVNPVQMGCSVNRYEDLFDSSKGDSGLLASDLTYLNGLKDNLDALLETDSTALIKKTETETFVTGFAINYTTTKYADDKNVKYEAGAIVDKPVDLGYTLISYLDVRYELKDRQIAAEAKILPKSLTIEAVPEVDEDGTILYGSRVPSASNTYDKFVGTEDSSEIPGFTEETWTWTYTAEQAQHSEVDVTEYTVTPEGYGPEGSNQGNYEIHYQAGRFRVRQNQLATPVVTWEEQDTTEAGTVSFVTVDPIGDVVVDHYELTLLGKKEGDSEYQEVDLVDGDGVNYVTEAETGMTCEDLVNGKKKYTYNMKEVIRENGAGAYKVQVKAIAKTDDVTEYNVGHKNVKDSELGVTEDDYFAAKVQLKWVTTGDTAEASREYGEDMSLDMNKQVPSVEEYVFLEGEENIPFEAILSKKAATGYEVKNVTASSATAANAKAVVFGTASSIYTGANKELSTQATREYDNSFKLTRTLESSNTITLDVALKAIKAEVELKFKVDSGDWYQEENPTRAKVTYGYTSRPSFTLEVDTKEGDTIVTDEYTYSYKWYIRTRAGGPFTEIPATDIKEGTDNHISTYLFPRGKAASDAYVIYCQVTATRSDNNASEVYTTLDEEFELAADGCLFVTVERGGINATVQLDDWTYGDSRKIPSVEGNVSGKEPVYYYSSSADLGESEWNPKTTPKGWSKEIPTDQGSYYVRALIPESENYEQTITDADEFTIRKPTLAVPTLSLAEPSIDTYGDLSWTASTTFVENNGAVGNSASKVTPLYTVKVYYSDKELAEDSAEWGEAIATYTKEDATSKNIADLMNMEGYYKIQVQATANNTPSGKDNAKDSAFTTLIQKVAGDVQVKDDVYSKVYDGVAIQLKADFEGTNTEIAEDATYQWYYNKKPIAGATEKTYDVTYVNQTGKYYCIVQSDGNTYYTDIKDVTILPREITITPASETKVYDGKALTNHSCQISAPALAESESIEYTFSDASTRTEAGQVDNVVTKVVIKKALAGGSEKVVYETGGTDNNYNVTLLTGTLTVTAKALGLINNYDSEISVDDISDVEYKDSAYTPKPGVSYTVNETVIPLVESQDFEYEYKDNVEASTDAVKAQVIIKAKGNYSGTIIKTFVINRKPVVITSDSAEKVYDATALTNKTLFVTSNDEGVDTSLISGHTISVKESDFTGSITNRGEVANTYHSEKVKIMSGDNEVTDNYDITYKTGTLKVTPCNITSLTISPTEFEYNADSQGPENVVVKARLKDGAEPVDATLTTAEYDVTEDEATQKHAMATSVGTYTYEVTAKGNYTGTLSKTYVIKDSDVPVVSSNLTNGKIYCGDQTITITDKTLSSVKINDVEVYQPEMGTSYTGTLTGTETGTVYTIVATDASGNQNTTMSVTVYKDHDFTDYVVSEDTYSQTAPCNHLCGATHTSALPHGTIHWEYAYSYETLHGTDTGVQGKEARATYAKVELIQSVKGSQEPGVVVATTYTNCESTCGNVADAVDIGNDSYSFTTYNPEDATQATGTALLPTTDGTVEYEYSIHITPFMHEEENFVRAFDYAVHSDEENRFNASIKYQPQLFYVPWKVTIKGLPEGVYPESINVKVMYAYNEDSDDSETATGYQVISQQASGNGDACGISKDEAGNVLIGQDGSVSYEGSYPVWKFKGNRVDSYYHRILVVGYTYKGTYYDISGEVDDSVVRYHQYKSDNSATDHETKTICYIPGTYSDELGTDDGAASGKILYTIGNIHLPVVAFDYNDSDEEPSTKPVKEIQKSAFGENVTASEIPGASEAGVGAPVRVNHDFLGWYTSANGGEKVTEIMNLTESQTLYAHWRENVAPEGKIAVKESASVDYWTAYTETEDITYELYYKEKQTIQITATDNKDASPKIQYYVTEEPKSQDQIESLEDSQWSTYPSSGIGLNESGKYIIYTRISDQAGNTTYLSSQGMIVDLVNPAVTGIETDKTYCLKQKFQVNDEYLKKVTVNGKEVTLDENHSYCLLPSDKPYTIVATDIAGNVTTISDVRVNAAHTFGYKAENNVVKAICDVDTCSLHNSEDMTVALTVTDHIYDGTTYNKAVISVSDAFEDEVITTGKRTIALEYYEKNAKGEYVTIDAPTHGGIYYARVLVNRGEKMEAACDYQKFEIKKVKLTIAAKPKTIDYLQEPANAGVTFSGFIEGEDETVLGGELKYSYNYQKGIDTGVYKISLSGLETSDYELDYQEGDLTVQSIDNSIEVKAVDKVYDAKVMNVNESDLTTKGNGTIHVTYYIQNEKKEYVEISSPRDAGIYYVKVVKDSDGNYNEICSDYKQFKITPKDVHVKAQDATMIYGDNPVEVVAVADAKEVCQGDDLGITATTEVTKNTNVGQYDIVPNCSNKNYHMIPENGTYTVEKKAVTDEMIHVTSDRKDTAIILHVVDGEKTLVEGVDYTCQKVDGDKNYDIIIAGIGNYKDVITKTIANPNWTGNIASAIIIGDAVKHLEPAVDAVDREKAKNQLLLLLADDKNVTDTIRKAIENESGINYDAVLYLEMHDAEKMYDADKMAQYKAWIEDAFAKIPNITKDREIPLYLDLSLYMTYTIDAGGVDPLRETRKITDTSDESLGESKGYQERVTITIPESMRLNSKEKRRVYHVIRVHEDNGKTTTDIIKPEQKGNELSFVTDKFSVYGIGYHDEILPQGIQVNVSEIEFKKPTDSQKIDVVVTPEDATNKNVIWTSSDETIATVDPDGVVRPVGNGTAIITVKTEDGDFETTIKVVVKIPDPTPAPATPEPTAPAPPTTAPTTPAPTTPASTATAPAPTATAPASTATAPAPTAAAPAPTATAPAPTAAAPAPTAAVPTSTAPAPTPKMPTPEGAIPVDDIMRALGVTEEEALQIQKIALTYGVSLDTLMLTESAIKKRKVDTDAKGTSFGRLKARAIKCKKKSLILKWTKTKGADGYILYGNFCNNKKKIYKYKKITTTNSRTFRRKMTKLKKGTYYKYLVVAYKKVGKKKITIASSVTVHATTLGGKFGVAKAVKLLKVGKKKKKLTKITLKRGKTATIKAKEIRQNKNKRIRDHRPICYESSNTKVIKVMKNGKMKAIAKGKCKVWVYAQNGVYNTIRVTVK